MKGFIYERKVAYYETDQMGIVHHSNYIRWMEEARLALLDAQSLSYAEMERIGLLIPVLSVSCNYKLPFRYGETFKIQIYPKFFNGVKCIFGYNMYGEDGSLRNTADSSHCFTDVNIKPVMLKKSHPAIYEPLKKWADENKVEE